MNKAIKYPLFLGAVGAFSTFLLATAYGITQPIIAQRIAEAATAGVKTIFPNASSIENVTANYSNLEKARINTIFEIKENGNIAAYGYEAVVNGYGGEITGLIVLSYTTDQVIGYRTINHLETKGGNYGDVLLSSNLFNQQFVNLSFNEVPTGIDLAAGSTAKVTLNAVKNLASAVLTYHLEVVKGVEIIIPEVLNDPLTTIKGLLPQTDEVINLKETYPDAKSQLLDIYEVKSAGATIAYGYVTVGKGFGGDIETLLLIDPSENKILQAQIINHSESSGYGADILDNSDFIADFINLEFSNAINVDFEAGVTATANGFNSSIKKALDYHLANVKVG